MVKKCEQCGAPAVDDLSLFCNLCGGYVREEEKAALAVCRGCGTPAPDDQSAFCTRCGLKYTQEPEDRYPVCTTCGTIVPDELAAFCNRCGEKIVPGSASPLCAACGAPAVDDQTLFCNRCGTPFSRPAVPGIQQKAQGSVVITKKRRSPAPPAHRGGNIAEDFPPDHSAGSQPVQPDPQVEREFAHLPLQDDESTAGTPRPKKYAHLPLVAAELKIKDSPRTGFYSAEVRESSSKRPKKHPTAKGLLDMFKR
jgi:hypothetical protein